MNINRDSKKNEAVLIHNDEKFIIWQDKTSKWFFPYGNLSEVNTGQVELQTALNTIYETINEQKSYMSKAKKYSKKTRRF